MWLWEKAETVPSFPFCKEAFSNVQFQIYSTATKLLSKKKKHQKDKLTIVIDIKKKKNKDWKYATTKKIIYQHPYMDTQPAQTALFDLSLLVHSRTSQTCDTQEDMIMWCWLKSSSASPENGKHHIWYPLWKTTLENTIGFIRITARHWFRDAVQKFPKLLY